MKKLISMLLIFACCMAMAGCGSKIGELHLPGTNYNLEDENHYVSEEEIHDLERETGYIVEEVRTTTCQRCKGNGICSHCNGDAFRDGRRCSRCSGTGHCSYCDGVGKLTIVEMNGKDYTLCGNCHGECTCSMCGGSGIYQTSLSTGTIRGNCMLCNGSGKCMSCNGTGWVELRGF